MIMTPKTTIAFLADLSALLGSAAASGRRAIAAPDAGILATQVRCGGVDQLPERRSRHDHMYARIRGHIHTLLVATSLVHVVGSPETSPRSSFGTSLPVGLARPARTPRPAPAAGAPSPRPTPASCPRPARGRASSASGAPPSRGGRGGVVRRRVWRPVLHWDQGVREVHRHSVQGRQLRGGEGLL